MTLSEYHNTYSWQAAIQLGPQLVRLAEELPAAEEMGLSFQLRQLMVEVPAAIAADLLQDGTTRHNAILKLTATLELIDHVYPALDTAATRAAADQLAERLFSASFGELAGGNPAAAGPPTPPPIGAPPVPPTPEMAALPLGPPQPAPEPAEVAPAEPPAPGSPGSIPLLQPQPAPAPPGVSVPVQPITDQEDHVQPDSVQ